MMTEPHSEEYIAGWQRIKNAFDDWDRMKAAQEAALQAGDSLNKGTEPLSVACGEAFLEIERALGAMGGRDKLDPEARQRGNPFPGFVTEEPFSPEGDPASLDQAPRSLVQALLIAGALGLTPTPAHWKAMRRLPSGATLRAVLKALGWADA